MKFSTKYLHKAGNIIRLAAPYFRRHKVRLLTGFLALVMVNVCQLAIPRITKRAVDALQYDSATPAVLAKYGGIIILLAAGIMFFRFGWRYLILGFSRLLEKYIRVSLFSHVLTLDKAFFHKNPPGSIMALATNDLTSVQMACGMGLIAFADAVFMSIATMSFMVYIHPLLTLLALLPMPFLVVFTSLLSARLHKRFRAVQEQFSHLTEFARHSLISIRLIRAYTQERLQVDTFDEAGRLYVKNNLRLATVQGLLFPFSGFVANLSMLVVIYMGGKLTIKQSITVGDFVAFMSYLYMLTWPMMALGWVANLFQRGLTSLDRIGKVIHARPQLKDPGGTIRLPEHDLDIIVKNLSFSYEQGQQQILHNISFEFSPGLTGIVGRTGSGKSTLCHIIARLYQVDDNTLYFANHDVNTVSLAELRSKIAYVPQDVVLFADTIAANISLGGENLDHDKIVEAAKIVRIHDEILAMPNGYESKIGERGVQLSGGQKQRLALARALLADRPILIIDDGLSAVDTETEHVIIANISEYLKTRTCIYVSHRVAPLVSAREIIVMDNGSIVDAGDHAALLASNTYFQNIYSRQVTDGNYSGREVD